MPYEGKRSRILTLDLLRGFFLFVIIIDHMNFFPSLFEFVTGRGEMWASAAEGFFIISGLLVGYIYGPRMAKNAWAATKKIWRRASLLYALTVVLTILFVWWGNHSELAHVKEGLWTQPPLGEFLVKTFTMQYYYGWADFLPYYAIFMVWAPLALYLTVKRMGWLVLLGSGLVWAFRGQSFELSWQILFMGSLVAGWYVPQIEAKVRSWSPARKRRLSVMVYGAAILLVAASALTIGLAERAVHEFAEFAALPAWVQSALIGLDHFRDAMTPLIVKWTLEPVRLLTALVWFVALYIFVRRREAAVDRMTRGFLRALGERSLVVYVTHAIVIFALLLVAIGDRGFLANTAMSVVVVGLIYALAVQWSSMTGHAKRTISIQLSRSQMKIEEV